MFRVQNYSTLGFKTVRNCPGFYGKPKKGKEDEFDVKLAKQSQESSQITSFIGVLECIKKLVSISEGVFSDLLGELSSISERIDLCHESTKWCEKEMDTLIQANKSGYRFQTSTEKEEIISYDQDQEVGLFTSSTMPNSFQEAIGNCEPPPALHILDGDPLNEPCTMDGIESYRQNWSDPYGIYKQWVEKQRKKTSRVAQRKRKVCEEREKKREKKVVKSVPKNVGRVGRKREEIDYVGKTVKRRKIGKKSEVIERREDSNEEIIEEPSSPCCPPVAPDVEDFFKMKVPPKRTSPDIPIEKVTMEEGWEEGYLESDDKRCVDGNILEAIKDFNRGFLKPVSRRPKKEPPKSQGPILNVGHILQLQIQFIAQAGAEFDDENATVDEESWDDDNESDYEW